MTRRDFVGVAAAMAVAAQDQGWVSLFNGRNLEGWRAAEGPNSWKVADGQLAADGPRSHLFYAGPVRNANFKNFELEVEARALANSNSGVYFHTAYQEKEWPNRGFEVQINNSQARERKKTGSLYNLRNTYKQFVRDDEWFKLVISVRGKRVHAVHPTELLQLAKRHRRTGAHVGIRVIYQLDELVYRFRVGNNGQSTRNPPACIGIGMWHAMLEC